MKKLLPLFVVVLVVAFMTPALASEVDSTVKVRELFAKADLVLKAKATLELKVIADIYVTRIDAVFVPDSRAMAEVVKKQINEDNDFALVEQRLPRTKSRTPFRTLKGSAKPTRRPAA